MRAGNRNPDPERFADAVLASSRVLVQLSVECLDSLDPGINLSEFRVLSVLSGRGPQRLIDIAASLGVTSTTATRLADRLSALGLVERVRQSRDRREIHLSISEAGRGMVSAVHRHRRRFVASVLDEFTDRDREVAFNLLARLAESAERIEEVSA